VQEDDSLVASWSYDASQRTMISYDTPEVIAKKAGLVKSMGLGGGMWWESSSDKKGDDSLISTVSSSILRHVFGATTDLDIQFVNNVGGVSALDQSANVLSFPVSKYDNLRAGFPNN
jgi:chitinase